MIKIILALCLITASFGSQAQTITVIWPFGMGDTQAHYSRSLIEELNRSQKKYTFILENRPGAGATIGARHVLRHPNHVLSASTAFFVRPLFYPNESHGVQQFRPLMTQCAAPMVIVSGKYKDFKSIAQQQHLTIGIGGLGATSHLLAAQIKKKFPNLTFVPYRGTSEASVDAVSGTLDMSVAFIGEIEQYLSLGSLHALGVTGHRRINDIPTLESQGFERTGEIVNMHSLLVPTTMPEQQIQHLRRLVIQAVKAPEVQMAYQRDHCEASNLDTTQTEQWFQNQIRMWKDLSQGVSLR